VTDDPETTKVYFFSHYLARTDWQGLCFGTLDVGGAKFQHVVSIAAVAEAEKRQKRGRGPCPGSGALAQK
jgi:hypothetical protein